MKLDKKAFKSFMREFLESVNEFNKSHYQYRDSFLRHYIPSHSTLMKRTATNGTVVILKGRT